MQFTEENTGTPEVKGLLKFYLKKQRDQKGGKFYQTQSRHSSKRTIWARSSKELKEYLKKQWGEKQKIITELR